MQTLKRIKEDVLTAQPQGNLRNRVEFYSTDETFRNILAKARRHHDVNMIFIVDLATARIGALQAVQTRQRIDQKGIGWYPSASSSRRFHIEPKSASLMAGFIDMDCMMDWDDFAHGLDRFDVYHD